MKNLVLNLNSSSKSFIITEVFEEQKKIYHKFKLKQLETKYAHLNVKCFRMKLAQFAILTFVIALHLNESFDLRVPLIEH
jgi:hypothetical protein